MYIIAFDSHKKNSVVRVETKDKQLIKEAKIAHAPGNITKFLSQYKAGSTVALETTGNWYWIVDEIEQAGMVPLLVHARKAKLMLGMINKTDKLDAKGMNLLKHTGTLPTVWIPPGELRDHRELPRTRMFFANQRTRLKNRIHSVLAKYGLQNFGGISDVFGKAGIELLNKRIKQLPSQTQYTTCILLRELKLVNAMIKRIEKRMHEVFDQTAETQLLMTMPGIGFILAVVIANELGDISRFNGPDRLASYAGTTPRVHQSGDRLWYGPLRPDTNHYLKWAYAEAGNSVAVNHTRQAQRHVSCLYKRVRERRGHAKAVGAVGRHLAEATYWILTKREPYRERNLLVVSQRGHKRGLVMSPRRLAE